VNIYLKIALTISIFQPKMHQIAFRAAGLSRDPLGELTALPIPTGWIKESLLLREGVGIGVEGGEKRGEEGRGWDGKGTKVEGEGGEV